jgi:hypothetical protein
MVAPSHSVVLRAGRFDVENGSSAATLDEFVSTLDKSPPGRLVIYFHGGLVDLDAGKAGAAELKGEFAGIDAASLFVVWESGWDEVLAQRLPAIFDEAIFKRLLRRVTQFFKGKIDKERSPDGNKGVGALPLDREDRIQSELDKGQAGEPMFGGDLPDDIPDLTPDEQREIERQIQIDGQLRILATEIASDRTPSSEGTAKSVIARGSTKTLMTPEVLDEIAPLEKPGAKGGVLSLVMLAKHVTFVVAGVISRFRNGRDHGVYLTIVEEVLREFYVRNAGKFLWDGMKEEIDQAFGVAADCGGAALIDALRRLAPKLATADGKPKVTVIGHSAGAIYASRLVQEIEKAKLPADLKVNVVLIAPACTFKVFRETVMSASNRIAGLRIFGMGDERERRNALVQVVYPASLLYFVSGVIEDERDMPLLGMQRFYGAAYEGDGFPDLAFVRQYNPLTLKHAYAWAEATGFDGANCDMSTHGNWPQAQETLKSIRHVVQNGL